MNKTKKKQAPRLKKTTKKNPSIFENADLAESK